MFHLVKFVDDGILYVCSHTRVKSNSDNKYFVRYKNLGVWEANILASGDKCTMNKVLAQYSQEHVEEVESTNQNHIANLNPQLECSDNQELECSMQQEKSPCSITHNEELHYYSKDVCLKEPEFSVDQVRDQVTPSSYVQNDSMENILTQYSHEHEAATSVENNNKHIDDLNPQLGCSGNQKLECSGIQEQEYSTQQQKSSYFINHNEELYHCSKDVGLKEPEFSVDQVTLSRYVPNDSMENYSREHEATTSIDNKHNEYLNPQLECSMQQQESSCFINQNEEFHHYSKDEGLKELECLVDQVTPSSYEPNDSMENNSREHETATSINYKHIEDSNPALACSGNQQLECSVHQQESSYLINDKEYSYFKYAGVKEANFSVDQVKFSSSIQRYKYSMQNMAQYSQEHEIVTSVNNKQIDSHSESKYSGQQELEYLDEQLLEHVKLPDIIQQNYAPHLYTTEILDVGDEIRMCDVDLLYSSVGNMAENNNITVQCKRRLEFPAMKNIPEKKSLDCDLGNRGKTVQEKLSRKRHFCPFCKKLQLAFGRHVLSIHKNEQIVQNILIYPKNSLRRKKELALLRGKGMHMYNMESKEKNATLVVRNPTKSEPDTFVPCPNCTAYFLPRNLARHHKTCIQRPPNRMRVLKMATNLRNSVDNKLLDKLLSDLKQDDITEVIRTDKTLLLLASSMSIKYAREKHLGGFIRQKLRQLSRLLITIKQIDHTVTDFKSCLIPHKYDTIREAVYKLCELNTDTFTYKRPSMASQLGAMLIDCVNAIQLDNIKNGLNITEHQKHLDDFLLVHKKEYGSLIAKSALSTLAQNKWNKTQVLPSVEDIQIFQEYIKTRAKKSFNYLKSVGFKYDEWLCLSKSCLLMLLTFNRRRVGEISRALITNFEGRQSISNDQLTGLNRLECLLASEFERMEIRGKKGRRVPVLLTKSHVNYIDMILKMRVKAGIPISNPFLFAVNSKGEYIDAGIVIREFSMKCGASCPDTLRGTYLRKQVATVSQILNLNDNEIQQLADFMGHDVAIHRLHYRQPEISLQITKLAKFFMAAGESNMDKYKGKTLAELQTIDCENQVINEEGICSSEDDDCDRPTKFSRLPTPNSNPVRQSTILDNNQICQPSPNAKLVYRRTPTKKQRKSHLPSSNSDSICHKTQFASPNSKSNYTTPTKKNQNRQDPDYSPSGSDGTPRKRKYCFQTWDSVQSPVRRLTHKKVPWSQTEKNIIFEEFKKYFQTKTLPSRLECDDIKEKYKGKLDRRTGVQIKAFVNNTNNKGTFDE